MGKKNIAVAINEKVAAALVIILSAVILCALPFPQQSEIQP